MNSGNNLVSRKNRRQRDYEFGHYLILTDTQQTEENYFSGLRESLPPALKEKLQIDIYGNIPTHQLVAKALEKRRQNVQYSETWLVFDKDQRPDFDSIVKEAATHGIGAAWSNPCFEIWMYAYFGRMPLVNNSSQCCAKFGAAFFQCVGAKYSKSDKQIYDNLSNFGDEQKAIGIAETQLNNSGNGLPSSKDSCTMVHRLVQQIAKYRNNNLSNP